MAAPVAAISSELIDQFRSVTGSNAEEARSLLEACNGNLEMAIGMHLDHGGGTASPGVSQSASAAPAPPPTIIDDDEVRAPIPQRQEVLVEDPPTFIGFRGRRKRGKTSVFDGFRDFQREARLREERVTGEGNSSASTSRSSADEKRGRLEDLFRPPIEIMYTGTFDGAKEKGAEDHKWLMVNVQNVQEFCCQMLNRDVWSNDAVKAIVREHFVLWQVYHDSEEGQRFTQFYNVTDWPYIAVLDPRTGENLVVWNKVDAMAFCDMATEFLSSHPTIDGGTPTPPPPKRRRLSDCIVDADEDSQLAAAIRLSIRDAEVAKQTQLSDNSDSDCELETFSDSDDTEPSKTPRKNAETKTNHDNADRKRLYNGDSKSDSKPSTSSGEGSQKKSMQSLKAIAKVSAGLESAVIKGESEEEEPSPECWQRLLGPDTDPMTRLVLRLPDGGRLELRWPCSTPLKALHEYANWMGYSPTKYELLTNYPRRILSETMGEQTFKDSKLHPQETVFIQEKDS